MKGILWYVTTKPKNRCTFPGSYPPVFTVETIILCVDHSLSNIRFILFVVAGQGVTQDTRYPLKGTTFLVSIDSLLGLKKTQRGIHHRHKKRKQRNSRSRMHL